MIVLLHPLASGPDFWNGVRAHLPAQHLLSCDLAAATPAAGLGLTALTDAVATEITPYDDGDVTIVGVSLGVLVALDLSQRYPALVSRMVLADGVPIYPEPMQQMWRERATTARTVGITGLLEPTLRLWFSPATLTAGGPVLDAATRTFLAFDPLCYARQCEILEQADLRGAAEKVTVPTLVVCGTNDAPPFVEAARWFHRTIDHSELRWIDGGYHAAAMEFPAEFAGLVEGFLTRPLPAP